MRKFIVWLKINWIKVVLFIILIAIVVSLGIYVFYIGTHFNSMENFSKRQIAGQMALMMPMFVGAQLLVLPLSFAMMWYFYKGGGIGGIKKNKVDKDGFEVHWDDIIGMSEAKNDAKEVVNLLKDHTLQKAVGGNIIKGALMIGPPGCGKTYLAKAMATECGLPMLTASGSDFVAMFMGQGASRMKSLFKQARAEAKIHGGCIIFIDEIDAFARQRAQASDSPSNFSGSASTSYNATINQFLTDFDGLRNKENNIIVLAATNVNEEELDEAIMRSGRFDRKIRVEKPNAEDREEIFKYYLSKVSFDASLDIPHYADKTKWFSPSDINNVVKEAGVFATRNNHEQINADDMKSAIDRIMVSIEKMGGDKILGDKVQVFWDDVIGMTDVKEDAWEVVKLLKDRNMAKAVGGKIVKGLVMFGPPGCGKTYLAKAIATESGFPFISIPGSEFVTVFMGEGVKKMKNVFAEARKMAKAEGGCIIFFDEIDSFARPRQTPRGGFGGTLNQNATINQFLTELDGLRQQENTIMVLGATNVREGDLDSAVMRAGRLERKLYVALPTLDDRKALFEYYLKKVKIADDVTPDRWARIAVGVTPSDIDNIIREGGLLALRGNRDTINHKDLMDAYDRITMGAVSREKYNKPSLLKTSYHEAGHAILTYLVHPTNEVIKATIKPRKGSLGAIQNRPIEELAVSSPSREHWLSEIQVLLAGYVAEKLTLGTTASGVGGGPGSDFHKATTISNFMVWSLGMGDSGLIGDFTAVEHAQIAQKTLEILNADAQKILQDCLQNTTKILTEHKEVLEYFAQELLEKGDLEYDDVQAIFNKFSLKPATKITESSPLPDSNPEA